LCSFVHTNGSALKKFWTYLCWGIFGFLFPFSLEAQEEQPLEPEIKVVDSLYREDQFYFTFTYNTAGNLDGLSQKKFSPGIGIGFLRDMPINKARTYAVALGLGYSLAVYNHNLYQYPNPTPNGTAYTYELISGDTFFQRNRLTQHFIEVPLEFRWRASTLSSHKFWRIYTGFKVSYLLADTYRFQNDVQSVTFRNNPDLNKLLYGCYLTAGWNTWNLYLYYGLNALYKNAEVNGVPMNLRNLNIGLQFYIL